MEIKPEIIQLTLCSLAGRRDVPFRFGSAWSKAKSKEENFGFGPKQNTKSPLNHDNHPPPPTTFNEVP